MLGLVFFFSSFSGYAQSECDINKYSDDVPFLIAPADAEASIRRLHRPLPIILFRQAIQYPCHELESISNGTQEFSAGTLSHASYGSVRCALGHSLLSYNAPVAR